MTATTPLSKALFSFLGIDTSVGLVEGEVSILLEKVIFLVIFKLLQTAGNHARIAHRAKINVFDVLRALLSFNHSPQELKAFLAWCKFQGQKRGVKAANSLISFNEFTQERQLKLDFCPVPSAPAGKGPQSANASSLANISGCQFYPPIPPSFTFKFTPVLFHLLGLIVLSFLDLRQTGR